MPNGDWRHIREMRPNQPAYGPLEPHRGTQRSDLMSHHFDTLQAKEDPRLNCCDLYLFQGKPGTTVMAMTSNADAGISSPDAFHPEGLYAVRFDTNGDAKEEVVFKFRFGEAQHSAGDEHRHVQAFRVIHARQGQASGVDGDVVAEGSTGA